MKTLSSKPGGTHLDLVWAALGLPDRGALSMDLKVDGQHVRISTLRQKKARRRGLGVDLGFEELEPSDFHFLGARVQVFFETTGEAPEDDGPTLNLRLQTMQDERDKDSGLVREVQTGDEVFDDFVFVDNDSSDADAKRLLARASTRKAVQRLVHAGHGPVVLTRRNARVDVEAPKGVLDEREVLSALRELLTISRGGGLRDARPERGGETLEAVLAGLAVLGVAWFMVVSFVYDRHAAPAFIGVFAGVLASFFARPAIEARIAGHSSSGHRFRTAVVMCGAAVAALVAAALLHANAAFDASAEERRGVVTHVETVTTRRDRRAPDVPLHHRAVQPSRRRGVSLGGRRAGG